MKSWQKRWFNIKGDYMYYYSTQDESKSPAGVIFLPGSCVIEHPFSAAESDKFLFEIGPESPDRTRMAPAHETYLLAAETDEERRDWIKAIKQVLYASIGGAIFGRSLEDTLNFEKVRDKQRKVPEIVQLCANYILEKGIDEEGIFRLPGRSVLIKKISDEFDRGVRPEIDVPEMDIHTAASLLKSYLRDLPSPLIPTDFYEQVMQVIMRELPPDPGKALGKLSELMCSIPVHNYNLLQYICQFLGKVAAHSDKNKMTSLNLATVFVQAFIRPDDDDPALLMATANMRTVATLVFIERCEQIFKVEYTSDGVAVVVDDLLRLGCGTEDIENVSSTGVARLPSMLLNPDLLGLEFNGSDPPAALRRPNADRLSRQVSMNQVRRLELGNNRRLGGVYSQNSKNGSESNSGDGEATSSENIEMPPENRLEPGDVKQEEDEETKHPVAPPRPVHQKQKLQTIPAVASSSFVSVGSDSAAVETLINLDLSNFSKPELRAHVDRLCQELVIRQKIIEDLSERAQLTEQKYERQVNAFMQKMANNQTDGDKCSDQLRLYIEKYGPLHDF